MKFLASILGQILRFIYETLVGLGNEPQAISYYAISVILMTLFIKAVTIPITLSSTKQSKKMAELQPELQELQKKYSYDPEILQQKQMQLYKDRDVKPAGSCLPMFIQIFIILALFQVMREPAKYLFDDANLMAGIQTNFMWIPDLNQADPYWFGLPLLNSLSQIMVSYLSMASQPQSAMNEQARMTNQMTMFVMPVMLFFLMKDYASGLLLYWMTSNLVEVVVRFITYLQVQKELKTGA